MSHEMAGGALIVRSARVHPTASRPEGLSDVVVEGGTITSIVPAGNSMIECAVRHIESLQGLTAFLTLRTLRFLSR